MTRAPIDRPHAAMQARAAQAASVLLLAAGGALAAWGFPRDSEATQPLTVPVVELPRPTQGSDALAQPVDFQGVAERLALVANSPKQPVVVVPETGGETTPLPPVLERRFLGLVHIGDAALALIVDGEKQRFVRVGDKMSDGSVIEEISEQGVTIRTSAGRMVLELVPRTGALLSVAAPTPAGGGGNARPASPGNPQAIKQNNMVQTVPPAGKGGRRRAGAPDGSTERFNEIVAEVKGRESGLDEAAIMERAKGQFEGEMMKQRGVKE